MNLLELFSTDRRLLDFRGSLIIRQLCLNLNTERIYRKFAEIIEKEDASHMPACTSRFSLIFRPGSRICQRHGAEIEYHSDHIAGVGRLPKETEEP